MAEKTREEVVCCRLVWLLPGRNDERPVEVDGAVVGKDDGAGKVILGAAAAGCSAADDASAGDGDLAAGDLARDDTAAAVRFAGRCSSSSSSCSASISASSSSST